MARTISQTITATTYDATFGTVSVTKRTGRPYSHAVIRVSDTGDVSASFHMTRGAAERAGGRPAFGVTRHVVSVDTPAAPAKTIVELPAGDDTMADAMRRSLNAGVMVAWINADLFNRADCDIRRSVVLWDGDRDFVMAMGADITPALFRQRLTELPNLVAHMYAAGVRFWSVGIA